jgi:hypothetical protein
MIRLLHRGGSGSIPEIEFECSTPYLFWSIVNEPFFVVLVLFAFVSVRW